MNGNEITSPIETAIDTAPAGGTDGADGVGGAEGAAGVGSASAAGGAGVVGSGAFRDLSAILDEVAPIGRRFQEHGYRLYLVGGIVRDLYLNRDLQGEIDIDLTTDALPETIKELVEDIADAIWAIGQRFGTIGLQYRGRHLEITTHRAESYDQDSRKPQVSFGTDINLDLSRRDFTVNAMAIELPSGQLVDPWGGVRDLEIQSLATPIEAEVSFSDDPLRMMRAARFMTKYGLEPADELKAAASELAQRISIVAVERIGQEWRRLLALDDPTRGVDFLVETQVLAHIFCAGDNTKFAQMTQAIDISSTRAQQLSLTDISGAGLAAAAAEPAAAAAEPALADDSAVGAAPTVLAVPAATTDISWGSDSSRGSLGAIVASSVNDWRVRLATLTLAVLADASETQKVVSSLRLSNDEKHYVNKVAKLALHIETAPTTTAKPPVEILSAGLEVSWLRRFIYECKTSELRDHVLSVASALAPLRDTNTKVRQVEAGLETLAVREPLERPRFLDGAEIMAIQNRGAGRWVGQTQQALLDDYFTNGPAPLDRQRQIVAGLESL